jgi:hypothetical protein
MDQQRSPVARWFPRWTLIAGVVALIGLALLFIPSATSASWLSLLPFALLLVCPLMMLFMMGSVNHGHAARDAHSLRDTDAEPLDLAGLAPDAQMQALRSELTRMNWRQEALRQDLERLEATRRN